MKLVGIVGGVHCILLAIVLGMITTKVRRVTLDKNFRIAQNAVICIVPGKVGKIPLKQILSGKKARKRPQAKKSQLPQRKIKQDISQKNVKDIQKKQNALSEKNAPKRKIQAKKSRKREKIEKKADVSATILPEQEKKNDLSVLPIESEKEKIMEQDISIPLEEASVTELICIGSAEYDEYALNGRIQQAVLRFWRRPVGFAKELSCEISLQINEIGKAAQVKITQSSGVLVYDMAARTAILKAEYPREIWNKALILQF